MVYTEMEYSTLKTQQSQCPDTKSDRYAKSQRLVLTAAYLALPAL